MDISKNGSNPPSDQPTTPAQPSNPGKSSASTKSTSNEIEKINQVKKNKNKHKNKYLNYIPHPGSNQPTKVINIYNNYSKKSKKSKDQKTPDTETKTTKNVPDKKKFKSQSFQTFYQLKADPELGRNFEYFKLGILQLFSKIEAVIHDLYNNMDPEDILDAKASIKKMVGFDHFKGKDDFIGNMSNPSSFDYTVWIQYLHHKGVFDPKLTLIEHELTNTFIIAYF